MTRLFFALWPDHDRALALADYAGDDGFGGGSLQRVENLHLTVRFLGEVDDATCASLANYPAAGLPLQFELVLEQTGWWRRGGIAWLGPRRAPEALLQLRRATLAMAHDCGLAPDDGLFRAHVTLARRSRRAPLRPPPSLTPWRVRELRLVASSSAAFGARYQSLAKWPLKAP